MACRDRLRPDAGASAQRKQHKVVITPLHATTVASFALRRLALLNCAVVKLGRADFDRAAFGFGYDIAGAVKLNRQLVEHRVARVGECEYVLVAIHTTGTALQLKVEHGNFGSAAWQASR